MTSLSNLVEDMYNTLKGCDISEEAAEELATAIKDTVVNRLSQRSKVRTTLTLSSIGKPLRKLWYDMNNPQDIEPDGKDILKFLYGDIIEDILLWLAKVSGHNVTDRQKEVEHYGIVGHIDSIIDGEVVDVKSASPMSFNKFLKGELPSNDPFGYLAQIASYDREVGNGHPAFLAMNKVDGTVVLYQPDADFDLPDTKELIKQVKDALDKPTPPDAKCYTDVADGASGNRVLSKGCQYCQHKCKCWQGLRAFQYSSGVKYFTHIEKEPTVEEIELNG